jgi:tripartite ATP-independent transporter DctM subunit
MTAGGISRRLVGFAETLVGHRRGGLAHSTIVSSMIFAGVSGSSTADTTAIGSVLIPAMKERGYKAGYAASLTAVAGTIGAIIPPSMTMIVYGSMANVSIGALFLGGIIPGILVGLALMGLVFIHSLDPVKYPELQKSEQPFNWGRLGQAALKVWSALLAPVIIIAGILGGVFTATEAGVIVCVYAFLVSAVIYRTITLADLPRLLVNAAVMTSMVSGIIGIAGGFGWFLAYSNFNQMVLNTILEITDSRILIFFMLIAVMLVLTMFVDSMAILIITVPIAVFIAQRFDIDPIHLGLAIVMATQIGSTTPPVAVLLFVASSIAKCSYRETIRYCFPFILAEIAVLVLVIVVPALVTWIPSLVF